MPRSGESDLSKQTQKGLQSLRRRGSKMCPMPTCCYEGGGGKHPEGSHISLANPGNVGNAGRETVRRRGGKRGIRMMRRSPRSLLPRSKVLALALLLPGAHTTTCHNGMTDPLTDSSLTVDRERRALGMSHADTHTHLHPRPYRRRAFRPGTLSLTRSPDQTALTRWRATAVCDGGSQGEAQSQTVTLCRHRLVSPNHYVERIGYECPA
eukprot:scaffold20712_cov100-Isochrysis_galbana.AAC.2